MESKCYEVINKMCHKQIGILEFDISSREAQAETLSQLEDKKIKLSVVDRIVYYKANSESALMPLGTYKSEVMKNFSDDFSIVLIIEIDLNLYSKYLFEECM